jgi:hypothetical protein
MTDETRRAERLRRAPKIVMGNDNTSEPIADLHAIQRFWIASRFQSTAISARFIAEIAFASGRR